MNRIVSRLILVLGAFAAPSVLPLSSVCGVPRALAAEATAVKAPPAESAADGVGAALALPRVEQRLEALLALARSDTSRAETALREALRLPWDLAGDVSASAAALKQLADDPASSPVVRNLSLRLQSLLADRRGDVAAARDAAEKSGLLSFWLSGPWGHYGLADFATVFAPEKTGGCFAAPQEGQPSWRRPDFMNFMPTIDPWTWTEPGRGAVYLYTGLVVQKDVEALLWIDTPCAYRVWLDDQPILTANRMEKELPREHVLPVALAKGNHRLLVKVVAAGGGREVAVRLTDGGGLRPAFCQAIPAREAAPLAESARFSDETFPVAENAPRDEEDAVNLLRVAEYALAQEMPDAAWTAASRAVKSAPDSPAAKFLLLRSEEDNPNIPPLLRDRNAERILNEMGNGSHYVGMLRQARRAVAKNRDREALRLLGAILAQWPQAAEAHALRCQLAAQRDWPDLNDAWCEEMEKSCPGVPESGLRTASAALRRSDASRAAEAYRQAIKLDASNRDWVAVFARAARDAGRDADALEMLKKGLARFPQDPALWRQLAQIELQAGRRAEAEASLRALVKEYPEDPAGWGMLGDALYEAGQTEEALAAYRAALARKPDRHDLRRLVDRLGGTPYAFWEPYAISAVKQLKDTEKLNLSGTSARLIDQTVLEVYPDGSFANFTHELQKVLHPGGVAQAGRVRFEGELLAARTLLPDGRAMEPMRLPQTNALTMPALTVGAAVEYAYLHTSDAPFDRQLRFPRWYFRSPDTEEEFVLSQYIVRVPAGYRVRIGEHNLGRNVQFQREEKDGYVIYSWTGRNMPRADHEEGSTHINERLPFIEIEGERDWNDINRILSSEFLGQTRATSSVTDAVEKLGLAGRTPGEQAQALRRFVVEAVRSTGRYRNASHVLAARRGDRNILLLALLKAAGLDAVYAAVRPPADYLVEPDWTIPALDAFTDRLVGLRTSTGILWLDTTQEKTEAGQVPPLFAGGTAFLLGEGNGVFVTLPACADEGVREESTLAVGTDSVTLDGVRLAKGWAARALPSPEESSERERCNGLEDRLRGALADVTVTKLQASVGSDGTYREEFSCSSRLGAPRRDVGGVHSLLLPLVPLEFYPQDSENRRETDFHRETPQIGTESLFVKLPAGAALKAVPAGLVVKSSYGAYALRIERAEGGLLVRRQFSFPPCRVPVQMWKNYVAFCQQIRQAESDPVRFAISP